MTMGIKARHRDPPSALPTSAAAGAADGFLSSSAEDGATARSAFSADDGAGIRVISAAVDSADILFSLFGTPAPLRTVWAEFCQQGRGRTDLILLIRANRFLEIGLRRPK